MTPNPQDEAEHRKDPVGEPLDDTARHLEYLTGMTADSARTYAAYLSGRYAHNSAFRGP